MGVDALLRPLTAAAVAGALGLGGGVALGRAVYPPLDVLLATSETVIGQAFAYPAGVPKVTAAIVALAPGQATGWHRHDAPLFAYMLEGELTVDYGPEGVRVYGPGDAFLEAFRTRHDGVSTGAGDARLLAVFMGAEGVANTVAE